MYDILIKNGTVIDGTGSAGFKTNLAIKKDKIKKIGPLKGAKTKTVINARGQYVVPGFVDIHNHSDSYWALFATPGLNSMINQGVTTIIGGNCGSSLAPLTEGGLIISIQKWGDISKTNVNWLSMAEFLKEIEKRKISLNFGTLVGHSTLRRGIVGEEFRELDTDEMKKMETMLENAMNQGAFGLSTGLAYSHAKVAPKKEIVKLAQLVKKHKGVHAIHIRNEANELVSSIKEAIEITKSSNVSTEISHLKAMGKKNWPSFKKVLAMIEKTKKDGFDINFDLYPYATTGSVLYILLPDWVAKGGKQKLLERLKNKEIRKKLIKEMQEEQSYEYDKIIIAISPADKTFIGKKITKIAQSQEVSVEEAIINMLIASEGRIITFFKTLNKENIRAAIKHPLSLIISNGTGYTTDYYSQHQELVHPRCFGSFPRALGKYVREEKIISWEEAIYKMTKGPADKIGIKKRGVLKRGNFADITIFDPKTVNDRATFENPFRYAQGISHVLVNGKISVEKGRYTGEKTGKILRKS